MIDSVKTVMLVDDHAVVRTGYRMLLEMSGEFSVISEAESGASAIDQYVIWRPDVVVMDLNLPGMSGIEATRRIVHFDADAKVLIFSIHDETIYITRSFDAGASGYLCKSCAPQEMVDAVRAVAAGQLFIGSGLAGNADTSSKKGGNPLQLLSPREFEVFQLLGKGTGTREIAELLSLSTKTVSNYSTLIKEKLGLASSTELVRVAMEFLASQKPSI
jgi:two-component system, NarL family, invasion response regulator UvrY